MTLLHHPALAHAALWLGFLTSLGFGTGFAALTLSQPSVTTDTERVEAGCALLGFLVLAVLCGLALWAVG